MADFDWPEDLVPYAVSFYLQPHTGGSESPFSRVPKVYGLSAPRWICSMSFRGGHSTWWGHRGQAIYGPRMDALLARAKGRQNRVRLFDFRRPEMQSRYWVPTAGNLAASAGATQITVTGLTPNTPAVMAGDYIGGDGRPHIIIEPVTSNSSGQAVVSFEPPLQANIAANAAVFGNPTGLFRLTDDDAGTNGTTVGELTEYNLQFVEDL